jgi:CHAT domain-containing protein
VVLSSCESAAEDTFYGDAPTLSGAFLQAGVRCIIGAAWPVPESIAAATMRSFYGQLQALGPVAALAAARRTITRESSDPYAQSFKVSGWD